MNVDIFANEATEAMRHEYYWEFWLGYISNASRALNLKLTALTVPLANRISAKSESRLFACCLILFCEDCPKSFTTSASYPKAKIRASGISSERSSSGHEAFEPSAVHVVV